MFRKQVLAIFEMLVAGKRLEPQFREEGENGMVSALSNRVRIALAVGEEQVVLICRNPTPDEMNRFLSGRFTSKGGKFQPNLVQERVRLINAILVDVENIGYENAAGEMVPLTAKTVLSDDDRRHAESLLGGKVESWKDLINSAWKCAAAMKFEEPQSEEEAGAKN